MNKVNKVNERIKSLSDPRFPGFCLFTQSPESGERGGTLAEVGFSLASTPSGGAAGRYAPVSLIGPVP